MNELATVEIETGKEIVTEVVRDLPDLAIVVGRWFYLASDSGLRNWSDILQLIFLGHGYSKQTLDSYATASKQFVEWTGRIPLRQVRACHVEGFYNYLTDTGIEPVSRAQRIKGLRFFFKQVNKLIPIIPDPFEGMSEKLNKKLNDTGKTKKLPALTLEELVKILKLLDEDKSVMGLELRAIVLTLVTSGLRSFELCQISWDSVDRMPDGRTFVRFRQKGGRNVDQEVWPGAIDACGEYFKAAFGRAPKSGDWLLYTNRGTPINKPTLFNYLKEIERRARDAGILQRKISLAAHTWRRTYCTVLAKQGMDLVALQANSRHANLSTLTERYIDSREPTRPYWDNMLGLEAAEEEAM